MRVLVMLLTLAGAPPAVAAQAGAAATTPTTATTAAMRASSAAGGVRVMSFNIRFDNPRDGENVWPRRRELLFRTIERFDPDLLGMQEVLPSQAAELRGRLSGYDFVGAPRTDGKTSGEMAAVMFRRARFEKVREGHFWLSETPDVVGSKGWDADLPRVASWAELRDKRREGRVVLFVNAHFDHLGKNARTESAKLLRTRIAELAGGDRPVIVTGDFNAPPGSPPYKELTGAGGEGAAAAGPVLFDAFAEVNPQPTTQHFTFHAFSGQYRAAGRIDWVLRSHHFRTVSAAIDRTNENGRYPSDHFPVTAVVEWVGAVKR